MSANEYPDLARKLARNFSWLTLQEAAIRLLGLATAIYLARTLHASDYGALGLALAVVSLASVLVHSGTGSRATRQAARDPEVIPRVYAEMVGFRMGVAVTAIVVLAALSGVLVPALELPAGLLALCSLLLVRSIFSTVWAFRGTDRMQVCAVADIVEKSLAFAGLLLLVHGVGNDLLWVPVLELVSGMAVGVWLFRRLKRLYPGLSLRPNFRSWPEIAREALPFGVAGLLASIYLNGGVLLLGWLATAASAAMFLVAQKVMLTLSLLLHVINNAAFPAASRLVVRDMSSALELASQIMRYYLTAIVPAFLLIAFHADDVLALLFGTAYREAGPVLVALLTAFPFVAASSSLQMLLRAIPSPMHVVIARAGGAVVLLVLAATLIPRLDAVGAAMALAAGEAASALLLFVSVRRVAGGSPWDRQCLAPLAAGALVAAIYALVASWPLWLKLPLAAATYAGLVPALGAMSMAEIRELCGLMVRAFRTDSDLATGKGHSVNRYHRPE